MCHVFVGFHPFTCSWEEEVAKLVKGDGHDSVREIESLLDPVAMVNVNINVQHARMVPEMRQT